MILLDQPSAISLQPIDNEYRYCIIHGQDKLTVSEILNFQSKNMCLEIVFPVHFRVQKAQWNGFFLPILESPNVRLVFRECKIEVERVVVQTNRDVDIVKWNRDELDLVEKR